MKHSTIVVASNSDIVTAGLTSIIVGIKDLNANVIPISTDDIDSVLCKVKPSVLIADTTDIDTSVIGMYQKQECRTTYFIGYYHSALPLNVTKAFDAMLSIYDDATSISRILHQALSVDDSTEAQSELTPREKEVVIGIVKGLSNKEIASEISVSVNTVMTHRRNIASKLQIHSPAGLTIYAIVSKLVTLDEIKTSIN